jgi:hypothetical protein
LAAKRSGKWLIRSQCEHRQLPIPGDAGNLGGERSDVIAGERCRRMLEDEHDRIEGQRPRQPDACDDLRRCVRDLLLQIASM